jgi:hypothetical protein
MEVDLPDGKGGFVRTSLGEMADLRTSMTPEKMEQYDLFQKSLVGDGAATRSLLEQVLPAQEPATPEDQLMSSLQKEVSDLKALVEGRLGPGLEGIQTQNDIGAIATHLKVNERSYPYLSRNPNGASFVHGQLQQIVAQQGVNFGALPQQTQLQALQKAFSDCEGMIKDMVGLYVQQPASSAPPGSNIRSVNDQGAAGGGQAVRQGRWPLDPRTGVPMVPHLDPVGSSQPTQGSPPLPAQPVHHVPTGGPVGLEPNPDVEGPLTSMSLADRIRARVQQAV